MTDIKLLPLPPKQVLDLHIPSGVRLYGHSNESMQDYARANVAHATKTLREQREFQAALIEELLPYQDEAVASRTEIEALRMEIKGHRLAIQQLYDRAERLTEALREAQKLFEWNAIGGPLRRRIDALLRDHDKEGE